jgi:hypothetical protein
MAQRRVATAICDGFVENSVELVAIAKVMSKIQMTYATTTENQAIKLVRLGLVIW